MRHDIYTMPEIMFVSGQSKTIRWRLFKAKNIPFNAERYIGNFSVVDYSDKTGDSLISKSLTFSEDDDGVLSIATVNLSSSDTLGLYGKYIYQITIKDRYNNDAEIPNQGILLIFHNINEQYLS